MKYQNINADIFIKMLENATYNMLNNSNIVNELNVFPVPDGDTGINMSLTISSGLKEVHENPKKHVGMIAKNFSRGLLMGARGNSGVILSQLFRGFASVLELHEEVEYKVFIDAFQRGYEIAYKAVMKPTEGTILTVARESAQFIKENNFMYENLNDMISALYVESQKSLERTPELLPVLKEADVVDSGGMGLVCIYEGFEKALKGEEVILVKNEVDSKIVKNIMPLEDDVEFAYCTEFVLRIDSEKTKIIPFKEERFKSILSQLGDSIVVVQDGEIVKIHVHTNEPGTVLSKAQKFGDFLDIKIDNMRESVSEVAIKNDYVEYKKKDLEKKKNAVISVVVGDGLVDLFNEIGCNNIIEGGQTMNPSTEDFAKAIKDANAETVYIFPNNSNIILAANQAAELAEECDVYVIPSKTVGEGYNAVLLFDEEADVDKNLKEMNDAISAVKSGAVTYAVRDSKIGDVDIKKDNYIAIFDKQIISTNVDKITVSKKLLDNLLTDEDEIITFIYGENVESEEANTLVKYIESTYPNIEVEKIYGGQPIYDYWFAVQ